MQATISSLLLLHPHHLCFPLAASLPPFSLSITHYLCKNQQSHFQDTQTIYWGVTLKGCTLKIPWTPSARYLPLGPPQHLKASLKSSLHQISNRFIKPGTFVYFLEVSSYRSATPRESLVKPNQGQLQVYYQGSGIGHDLDLDVCWSRIFNSTPVNSSHSPHLCRKARLSKWPLLYWLNDQGQSERQVLWVPSPTNAYPCIPSDQAVSGTQDNTYLTGCKRYCLSAVESKVEPSTLS
ncbi:hypothetical protein B0H10DRAFT_1967168 [Mycena sp. CBHHK59/15]|nr:hypothetical protein B0H10DRAFT_1967168 [Mycena sp. CBHHK59/15]